MSVIAFQSAAKRIANSEHKKEEGAVYKRCAIDHHPSENDHN